MASGSEVSLALKTAQELKKENINVNIVSVPCYDLLQEQPKEYIEKIIDKNTIIFALEASTALEYYKYANIVIGMDTFGASGKADELFEYFGFTVEKLKSKILKELSLKV